MLAFNAAVVAQNTLIPSTTSFTSLPVRHSSTRWLSRWPWKASSQFSSEPMRMKSMLLSTSFEHISSTARLVYDSNTMFECSSVSSSFSMLSSPNEVFPVPGGPITRNMSRDCLARSTRVLNLPYSPCMCMCWSTVGVRWLSIKSRRSLFVDRKLCRPLYRARADDSNMSCSIAQRVSSGASNTCLSVCELRSTTSTPFVVISFIEARFTIWAQALGTLPSRYG